MTHQEFQDKIKKANLFDKYLWYCLFSLLFPLSFYLFYSVQSNPDKFKQQGSYTLLYFLSAIILFSALYFIFYLLPNRYKIITIESSLTIDTKRKIVTTLLEEFNLPTYDTSATYYYYEYGKSLLSWGYNINIAFDTDGFYISVQGRSGGGAYGGGFVDLGGTERLRKKITSAIALLINPE